MILLKQLYISLNADNCNINTAVHLSIVAYLARERGILDPNDWNNQMLSSIWPPVGSASLHFVMLQKCENQVDWFLWFG